MTKELIEALEGLRDAQCTHGMRKLMNKAITLVKQHTPQEQATTNPMKVSLTDCAKAIAPLFRDGEPRLRDIVKSVIDELIKRGINITYD